MLNFTRFSAEALNASSFLYRPVKKLPFFARSEKKLTENMFRFLDYLKGDIDF